MPEQTDRTGWYEFITADKATTHIAYVYEDGSIYFPEGPTVVGEDDFTFASARGRVYRLVREEDVTAEAALRARVAELEAELDESRGDAGRAHGQAGALLARVVELQAQVAARNARIGELEAQRPRIERRLGNVDALPPGSQIVDDDGTPALKVADLPLGATDGDGYRSEWTTGGGIVGTYDFAMPVTVLHEPAQEDEIV